MKPSLAVCLLLFSSPLMAAETIRYVALVDGGTQAGSQVVVHGDDGVTRVDFIFKDNGRGPELKEEYELAEDGTFKRYQVKGSSTFGAPVDETFTRDGDTGRWKSTSDQGEHRFSGTALYTPLGGTPQSSSVAIAALARRADGRLPLVPSGALSARKVASTEVANGADKRQAELLALTGIGLTPTFVWVTAGAQPRLFAYIFPGFLQLIEDGWQGNADALEKIQKDAEGEALADMQKRLARPLAGTTLIRNARIFDSENAVLGDAADVAVRDGRIVSVGPAGSASVDAQQVVDAAGRVLLPGLYDMHAHAGRWDGGLQLAAGVTSMRDMGNDNATLQQLMAEQKAGTLLSPQVIAAGFIEGESKMSARHGFVIKDLAEAKKAVDWYADNGYPQVKIYNSFPKELLRETAAYAHQRGLRVSGHVPAFMRAQEVVEQGYDELQHINQLLLNFFVTPETDTRTLERFYLVAEKTDGLDFDSRPVQDFIALLAEKKIVVDPTLATFEFLHQREGQLSPIVADVAEHLPPDVQRSRRAAEMNIPDDATGARYKRSFDKLVDFVGRMYRAGVPLVAGTDELPGFTLQRELELYVQAGLTPAQALQVATWNGAKYSGTLADSGSIAPGKQADLILVDGDPTRDIADIRKVALVIQRDKAYYPGEIHQALGIEPFAPAVQVQTTATAATR
ncbi:amidohydrolase family protein [Pseudoxanthomonas wuyuanensis]|uniref:Imidazolonepropionase n=1 Tax=Pseudoxanthomonas wuyuanensis TaxID=1073196 RepID=A0A286CXE5_9GAMM|nr:amidohydrolase family protein [Pseudoxanthomonas wuyuanensis]SOD51072.1 Imidazolonepropionase [Pseudoxanthomonas wuyuanensis]